MARRLGTIMIDMGYLDEDTLWKVLEEQKRSGNELLGKVAVKMGPVKEDQVLKAIGKKTFTSRAVVTKKVDKVPAFDSPVYFKPDVPHPVKELAEILLLDAAQAIEDGRSGL